jgi:hypothetical protein
VPVPDLASLPDEIERPFVALSREEAPETTATLAAGAALPDGCG